jgi:hypothetical protein
LFYLSLEQNVDYPSPVLCNIDGSGCIYLQGPTESLGYHYGSDPAAISPSGKLLVWLAIEGENAPEIWIVKLPGQEIIQKIPLFSEAVKALVPARMDPNYPISFYQSATNPGNIRWSPNGRFLAFVAAWEDADTDLYVYDAEQDTVLQLSSEPESIKFAGWSPDSQWLVYMVVSTYGWDGVVIESVNAVNVEDENTVLLYTPRQEDTGPSPIYSEAILNWTSEHSFLVETMKFEEVPRNLRKVDIEHGVTRELFGGIFSYAGWDGETQTIFINLCNYWGLGVYSSQSDGMYRVDLQTGALELFAASDCSGYWSPTWEAVVLISYPDNQGKREGSVLGRDGELILTFEGNLDISPNGELYLITDNSGGRLYERGGELLVEMAKCRYLTWLDDSSGFFCFRPESTSSSSGSLYLYLLENDWDEFKVASKVSGRVTVISYP